jgi:protein O-GlcNAc transferase
MRMKPGVALCVALILCAVTAAAAPQEGAKDLLTRGVELEQAGRFQEALDLYQQVLRTNPEAGGVYTFVGNAQLGLGRFEEALASYRRAARHDATDAAARYGAGNALYNLRRFAEAAEEYRAAARLRPDLPDAFANLSSAFYNLDRYAEAVAAAREAVRVKPDYAAGYVNLSWYYSMTDQHRESLEAARRGAELDPSNQMAHTNMCRAYNDLGQFAAALDACERALRLKPEDGETLYYLGMSRKGLKRPAGDLFARALAGLEAAESPEADFTYLAGAAYSQLGRHDEAIAAYRRVLAERPAFVKARYNLAVSYLLVGDRGAALAEQRELRRLAPEKAAKLDALLAEAAPARRP